MQRQDKTNRKIFGVYIQSLLTMKVILPITEVGKNMKDNLEKIISKRNEGKCIAEGFIRPGSINVIRYSSGVVNNRNVEFETVFECMICHPVEGMLIECDTKTITKAGIHAEVVDNTGAIPITVFIARDHHYNDKYFGEIKENMKITIRVIGVRYELNDPYICVIGKLSNNKKEGKKGGSLNKINIEENNYEENNYEENELENYE
jgi:DNA-directed RNA polymerase subunit E'/Rpb7